MNYVYSASQNSFYPIVLEDSYRASGTWPVDGVEVEDSVYIEYAGNTPPDGKVRSSVDGLPVWVDIVATETSAADEVAVAQELLSSKMSAAKVAITPLQYASDLGVSTADELIYLNAWKLYVVELSRLVIDEESVSSLIWPSSPDEIKTT